MKRDDPLYNYFKWQKQNKKSTDKFTGAVAKAIVYGTAYALTRNSGRSTSNRSQTTYRTYSLDWNQGLDLDVYTGKFTISILQNGYDVCDTYILNKIKRTPEYYNYNQDAFLEYQNFIKSRFSYFIEGYKSINKPLTLDEINYRITQMKPKEYKRTKYEIPRPNENDILAIVKHEAIEKVSFWKFWKIKKMRQEYVDRFFKIRLEERIKEWEINKERFESSEDDRASLENKKFTEEYNIQLKELRDQITYNESLITDNISKSSHELFEEYGLIINSDYIKDNQEIRLMIQIPLHEILPLCHIIADSNGKLKPQKYTIKEHKCHLIKYIFNMMYIAVSKYFNQSVYINNILLQICTNKNLDADNPFIEKIAVVNFDRMSFTETNFSYIYPENDIVRFQHNLFVTKSCVFKEIKEKNIDRLSNRDDVFDEEFNRNLLNVDLNIGYYKMK